MHTQVHAVNNASNNSYAITAIIYLHVQSRGVKLLTLWPCQFQRSLKMVCRKGLSYFVDVCLILGILANGIYLARNGGEIETPGKFIDDDGEEMIFEGAPPYTEQNGHPIRLGGTFSGAVKLSVELAYSRDRPLLPIEDPEEFGDSILNALPKV